MILSLLVAVGIWVYVDNREGYSHTIQISEIPVEYLGEDTTLADKGLMLLSDSEKSISLKLEGTKKVLMKLDPSTVRIQADLSAVTSTGRQNVKYSIIYPSREFTNNLTLKWASSYAAVVDVGKLYSKNVEIRCDIKGTVADGYIAGEVQFLPEKLEIRGQEADVEQVSYAKVTLAVDDATETVKKSLAYTLYDADNQEVDGANIHPTADQIQVTMPVNVVKELPLKMDFVESPGFSLSNVSYTIEPAFITVSGDAKLLDGISNLVLDKFDLSKLGSATAYNYAITVPEKCENLSGVTRATLRISFKDMASADLVATKFQCENEPAGKTVEILTTELSVKLRGTAADIAAVRPEDLTVTADLNNVGSASGSYTVPAQVQVETAGNVGVIGSYQIKITISEEP
jgi:YbbR domain-containing protein